MKNTKNKLNYWKQYFMITLIDVRMKILLIRCYFSARIKLFRLRYNKKIYIILSVYERNSLNKQQCKFYDEDLLMKNNRIHELNKY